MNRRRFLTAAAPASLAATLPAAAADAPATAGGPATPHRHPIGVSTYSFWRFKNDAYRPAEKCLELAHEMGFDGVELLQKKEGSAMPESGGVCGVPSTATR